MNSYMDVSRTESYKQICDRIKLAGHSLYKDGYERIVFTNGCFDLMHPGHISTLKTARNCAGPHGAVVVGLNSDESIKRLKGGNRPILDCDARAMMVLSIRFVDYVIAFDEDTPLELIKELRPTIIVKGGDYKISEVVGNDVAMIVSAAYDDRFSTTKLIQKIVGDKCEF